MNKKSIRILIIILIILIITAGGALAYKIYTDKQNKETVADNGSLTIEKEQKKVQIYKGDERPIAVMIDNHNLAWPQAGLNEAYIVYEIIAEGGETRLMPIFKGVDLEKIGPIRSSRHYFLDYVMENDAIYTHFGWSPQAQSDIIKYSINNINGLVQSEKMFWRAKDKAAPHNVATSTKTILQIAENEKYKTTSDKKSVLNYVTDEEKLENGQSAISVTIPHSKLHTVKYEYDEETGRYNRLARNKTQTDWDTKAKISTKNIIITLSDNYDLPDKEDKGRQGLYNIGTFDGYYITNGKAIKIKCIKSSREEQTKYTDLEGNEIKVNDGNTFVNITSIDSKIGIEGIEEVETTTTNTTKNKI